MEKLVSRLDSEPLPKSESMPAIPPPPPDLAEKRCAYGVLITEELKMTLIKNVLGPPPLDDPTHISRFPPAAVVRFISGSLHFQLVTDDVNRKNNRQPCAVYASRKVNDTTGEWYTVDLRLPCTDMERDIDACLRRFEEAIGGLKPQWHPWY